ncbi:YkvA family protein [Cruoricaptor ignavus]|nr:YkvA family protein [Cruoricaptor ignavus]
MIKQWRKGNYKTSQVSMWTVFLGLAYIISPIDILPEIAIPFVGIVDDLAVLAFLMPRLMNEVERFLQWESDKKNDITTIEVDAE